MSCGTNNDLINATIYLLRSKFLGRMKCDLSQRFNNQNCIIHSNLLNKIFLLNIIIDNDNYCYNYNHHQSFHINFIVFKVSSFFHFFLLFGGRILFSIREGNLVNDYKCFSGKISFSWDPSPLFPWNCPFFSFFR